MEDSPTQSHVLQLAHPPIPIVRIGIIGLGNRGATHPATLSANRRNRNQSSQRNQGR